MALLDGSRRIIAFVALTGAALSLGGCGAADVQIDAPILEAAGINLTSKKPDDENVPERAGIVMPPSTEKLPEPGTQTAAARQNWPQDPDQLKATKAKEAEEAYEKYCREGDWSDKRNIDEFNKNIGEERRCPSLLGKTVSEQLGTGSAND